MLGSKHANLIYECITYYIINKIAIRGREKKNTYLHNVGEYGILNKILLHGEQGMGSAPCGVLSQEKERKRIAELKI